MEPLSVTRKINGLSFYCCVGLYTFVSFSPYVRVQKAGNSVPLGYSIRIGRHSHRSRRSRRSHHSHNNLWVLLVLDVFPSASETRISEWGHRTQVV